jgi:hypothetical protein
MNRLVTVYVSIGNSDDKLRQALWSEFRTQTRGLVRHRALEVFGDWVSPSADPWQNACIAFTIDADEIPILKGELRNLAAGFGQDSIAWAEVPVTEFIGPAEALSA